MIGLVRRWVRQRRVNRWRRRSSPTHPALGRYLASFEPLDDAAPLSELRFVVLDTETTGLDIAQDRILTIAAVSVEALTLRPAESLDVTLEQAGVGAAAAPIHGLVRGDLEGGATEADALGALLDLLGNAVLVAHHAAFDVGILNAALARHGAAPLLNDVVDTERLARRLRHGPLAGASTERFSLDATAARHGLETDARHTAAGDALLTAELLLRLLAEARKAGLRTLGDLR